MGDSINRQLANMRDSITDHYLGRTPGMGEMERAMRFVEAAFQLGQENARLTEDTSGNEDTPRLDYLEKTGHAIFGPWAESSLLWPHDHKPGVEGNGPTLRESIDKAIKADKADSE